jgi:HK97 family phage portal protein
MSLISSMFTRATIQSPSVPLSEAFDLLTQGETSKTGINVTETKALGLPAFWKGVNLIARAIGKTPIAIKVRKGESKTFDRTHPAWYLVRKLPSGANTDVPLTAFIFKQTIQASVLMQGNGYAYIQRDNQANPISMILLDSNCVVPIKENGRLIYVVSLASGEIRKINPMNMLHIRGLSYDGITGYSVIDIMKDSLGLNLAYQINQSVFFRNGMKPGWIIEVPWRFKDEDAVNKFRQKLGKVHQGIERSHIPAILENGAKATELNISQEDAQFLQSREFDLRMLSNILFLPSSKLNDIAKVAYNSLEQENQSVLDEAYEPWFVIWEEELEFKLLSEKQKEADSHEIIFERRKLVQTPFKDRIEGYNKGVLGGWLGRDEVRQWEDMNPIPDGLGEKFFRPVNVVNEGEEQPVPPPTQPQLAQLQKPDPEEEDKPIEDTKITKAKDITKTQIRETATRLFQRRIVAASKRKSVNVKNFMDWVLDEVFPNNRRAFMELLDPKVKLLRLLEDKSTDTRTEAIVDDYLLDLRRELNQLTGMVEQTSLVIEVDRFMIKHETKVECFVSTLIEKG